jgi:hypothetical protein
VVVDPPLVEEPEEQVSLGEDAGVLDAVVEGVAARVLSERP